MDSPDVELKGIYSDVSTNESFVSYLMFNPQTTGSIWVPLRQVPWSWNASATRVGGPNTWVQVGGSAGGSYTVGPDADSTVEPVYSGRAQDLQLH